MRSHALSDTFLVECVLDESTHSMGFRQDGLRQTLPFYLISQKDFDQFLAKIAIRKYENSYLILDFKNI